MHQTLTLAPNVEVSPYVLSLRDELRAGTMRRLGRFALGDLEVEVCQGRDSVWCLVRREGRGGLALRTIHAPGAELACRKAAAEEGEVLRIEATSAFGTHAACFATTGADLHRLRATTRFTPVARMRVPYLPRDLYVLDADDDPVAAKGNVEAAQRGHAAGLVYFRVDDPGSRQRALSAGADGAEPLFPRYGDHARRRGRRHLARARLPAADPETQDVDEGGALEAGTDYVLSDAIVVLRDWAGDTEQEMARQFLQMLAPPTRRSRCPRSTIATGRTARRAALRDLESAGQARRTEYGELYLMPYPDGEYPDAMVQLSVIEALHEYEMWLGKEVPIEAQLMKG